MFKKSRPLQSKSEIILRNIVVLAMVVFFIVFLIIPIGIAFAGSFHEWNPLSGTYKFLGLENYKQVFTSKLFGKSMFNTVIFSVVVIVFRVGLGLGIAYAIYSTLIKHKSFFRAVYYMPVVTPMVAVAFVWKFMYNPQIGIINKIFGLDINWLMNPKTALIAVIIMTIWKDFGYAVVMYMAGLYSLPADVMEAAQVDGASGWQKFRYITLPLLKPMTLFVVITSIISYYGTSFTSQVELVKSWYGDHNHYKQYLADKIGSYILDSVSKIAGGSTDFNQANDTHINEQ